MTLGWSCRNQWWSRIKNNSNLKAYWFILKSKTKNLVKYHNHIFLFISIYDFNCNSVIWVCVVVIFSVSCQSWHLSLFFYHQITNQSKLIRNTWTNIREIRTTWNDRNIFDKHSFHVYLAFLVWSMSHLLTWRKRGLYCSQPLGVIKTIWLHFLELSCRPVFIRVYKKLKFLKGHL